MKILDEMIEELKEEVEGAREYAEKYVEAKALNNMPRAAKYKEMAHDELKHATIIRGFAMEDAESIKRVHTLTEEEAHHWEHCHKKINDEIAMVNHILSM